MAETVTAFDRAFMLIVGEEGVYSNDPDDPGGETKYGISKRSYPKEDIKNLTLERAKMLYERDYWNTAHCDTMPSWREQLLTFDCAVNQGVGTAIQIHSRCAGNIEFDIAFQAERALHYTESPKFTKYGRGWMRRLFRMLKEAQK